MPGIVEGRHINPHTPSWQNHPTNPTSYRHELISHKGTSGDRETSAHAPAGSTFQPIRHVLMRMRIISSNTSVPPFCGQDNCVCALSLTRKWTGHARVLLGCVPEALVRSASGHLSFLLGGSMSGTAGSGAGAAGSVGSVVRRFLAEYGSGTSSRLKVLDAYLLYVMLTGALQFGYCLGVGTFPFNSFLSGFISAVGSFILGGQ